MVGWVGVGGFRVGGGGGLCGAVDAHVGSLKAPVNPLLRVYYPSAFAENLLAY